jgi:ferredoxin-nitrite reductase
MSVETRALAATSEFTQEQKEYFAGFMAGIAQRGALPFVSVAADGKLSSDPGTGKNLAEPVEEMVFGTPRSELCKQEIWKLDENPLDIWDKLLVHAEQNKTPDEADTFRFRYHGLFYVAPAQNSIMLRCRIPGGELTSLQMIALADIAEEWGGGYADVTTRSNIQIREIAPRNLINVLTRLQEVGLTARGSGVDNVRNITASPTAGIDRHELFDTRPLARALHYYILNQRDLYGLPRKFNVAFDGGGAVSVVAETNDIGFMAVRVGSGPQPLKAVALKDRSNVAIEPGVYFRVHLAGITGHKQLATDAGMLVKPTECVAVAAAMIRVFSQNGCRTDRKKARLKYLIDQWGIEKFLAETQKKLALPLLKFPASQCVPPSPPIRHGHIGAYKQSKRGLNYIGVVIPVGRMKPKQMRRLAELAANYGTGELRLTPWQNLLLPNIPDGFVETVKRSLVRLGFHHESTAISGGLVACTGNTGCKWAATNTKGQALELARYLEKRVQLDQPINIHLTGCQHSCAQHYVGDIGLMGVKTMLGSETVEAYNIVLGGGVADQQGIARDIFKGIPFSEVPRLLERILAVYKLQRNLGEPFVNFIRRHDLKQLQEMFSE